MKILFDLFPVLLFFIAYKFADIYVATGVAVAATVLQLAWAYFIHRKVEPMMWFSAVVVVIFGSLTLVLHDPTFIKWKPTIIYWGMAIAMAVTQWGFRRNPMQAVFGSQLELPEEAWRKLNFSWMAFFAVMGVINIAVAYRFSEQAWVNFKLFGGTGLMLAFVVVQSLMLSRYLDEEKK